MANRLVYGLDWESRRSFMVPDQVCFALIISHCKHRLAPPSADSKLAKANMADLLDIADSQFCETLGESCRKLNSPLTDTFTGIGSPLRSPDCGFAAGEWRSVVNPDPTFSGAYVIELYKSS
jgi:hypothetical protein